MANGTELVRSFSSWVECAEFEQRLLRAQSGNK
jgi:hypothetical protein